MNTPSTHSARLQAAPRAQRTRPEATAGASLLRLLRCSGLVYFASSRARARPRQRAVEREPTPDDIAARAAWQPDPSDPSSFDYLLQSKHGAIDIVPRVSGTYDELRPRASAVEVGGQHVWVESIHDLLATLTVARRQKDRDRVEQLRTIQRASDSR